MQHKILVEAEDRMKKALESVRHEFVGVRTGKASPGLLDTVKVKAISNFQCPISKASDNGTTAELGLGAIFPPLMLDWTDGFS